MRISIQSIKKQQFWSGSAGPDVRQSGFTIVELMIATLVFTSIMVVITVGVLHFTSGYYKGINSSTTQNTARGILDTITQAIQFSGSTVSDTSIPADSNPKQFTLFCTDNHRYIFKPGAQFETLTDETPGLYVMPEQQGSCTMPGNFTGGTELLSSHMRIASLTVQQTDTQTYTVHIRLAYSSGGANDGDDLLCIPSIADAQPGSCTNSTASPPSPPGFADDTLRCRGQIGSQFCAVSALTTTIHQRVSNSELGS